MTFRFSALSHRTVRGIKASTTVGLMLAFVFVSAISTLSTLPASAAEVVDSGSWTKKGYEIKGGWKIVAEGESLFLELDEAFSTRKAPDLKLFLSSAPLPRVTNDNATTGTVLIAPLKSAKGAQRYALPKGVDLGSYKTLLLHCEQYSKLWGGATLKTER